MADHSRIRRASGLSSNSGHAGRAGLLLRVRNSEQGEGEGDQPLCDQPAGRLAPGRSHQERGDRVDGAQERELLTSFPQRHGAAPLSTRRRRPPFRAARDAPSRGLWAACSQYPRVAPELTCGSGWGHRCSRRLASVARKGPLTAQRGIGRARRDYGAGTPQHALTRSGVPTNMSRYGNPAAPRARGRSRPTRTSRRPSPRGMEIPLRRGPEAARVQRGQVAVPRLAYLNPLHPARLAGGIIRRVRPRTAYRWVGSRPVSGGGR